MRFLRCSAQSSCSNASSKQLLARSLNPSVSMTLAWRFGLLSKISHHAHNCTLQALNSLAQLRCSQPYSKNRVIMSQQPSAAWRRLPAAVVLETCSFLDAEELGRLEMCGRQSLGDGARAWKDQMSRIHRGNLATLPPKKFLAAHARAQALYPSTADVTGVQAPFRPNESVSFDEFSFTVVLAYNGPQRPGDPSSSEVCLSAAFEYMRLTGKSDEMGALGGLASLMFAASPEDRGQARAMPWLRTLAYWEDSSSAMDFLRRWGPTITLICTRKSDGAAIKVAVFDTCLDEDLAVDSFNGRGTLYFNNGQLHIQHGYDVYDYHMTLEVVFDQDTGRVEAFCGGVYHSTPDLAGSNMSNEMFYALLRARLDESMRA